MKFGVCLPTFDQHGTREAITQVARRADDHGWDSVWTTDHVLMAANQQRPYGHLVEAMTTLAYVAGMTQRVRLGTSVIILAQRNPIVVAKEAAAIDVLSGGRMILGVGAGWNAREFAFLGADFHRRGRILDEGIQVMRALWTQPQPAFEGRFFKFSETVFSPKPVQPGGIPIWVGGNSEPPARRAARLGDGWHITGSTPEQISHLMNLIQPEIQRQPFTLSARMEVDLTGRLPAQFPGMDGSPRRRLSGSVKEIIQGFEDYARVGVEYIVCVFTDEKVEDLLAHMRVFEEEVIRDAC
ncbi:MAG: hypothetical protein A2Z04_06450 [Chloroflexi bacterium RBG_16_57_9]|nr:MAG: hypothetical protein A2Z04_06450 [Chloroflexi bacterium RBG_16_57_9]